MLDPEQDQMQHMAVIAPLLPGIHAALSEGVMTYLGEGYSDAVRAEHCDRTVANIIYDHCEKALMRSFQDMPGVTFLDVNGMHVMSYRGQALIRAKKVDAFGRHANYRTLQQQEYDDGMPIPDLPPEAVRLMAGYQLDAANSAIERIMIARQIGREVIWTAQVDANEAGAQWHDITPRRFAGTTTVDLDAARARRGRR